MSARVLFHFLCLAASLAITETRTFAAQDCRDPACAISAIPKSTTSTEYLLQTKLKSGANGEWHLLLNGSDVFSSAKNEKASVTDIKLILHLREGNNRIEFVWTGKRTQIWRGHVFREPDPAPRRRAVLLLGNSESTTDVEESASAISAALEGSGIAARRVRGDRYPDEMIDEIQKSQSNDSLIIYYVGPVSRMENTGEPLLSLGDGTGQGRGIRFSTMIRDISSVGVPTVSVVVVPVPLEVKSDTISVGLLSQGRDSESWIDNVGHARTKFELVLPNTLSSFPADATHDPTKLLVSQILTANEESNPCNSLRGGIQSLIRDAKAPPEELPIYIAVGSFQSFCFAPRTATHSIQLTVATEKSAVKPYKRLNLSVSVPETVSAAWLEVWVDGVIVRHQRFEVGENADRAVPRTIIVPVDFGKHLVKVVVGRGFRELASETQQVNVDGSEDSDSRDSHELSARVLSHSDSVSSGLTPLRFLVSDSVRRQVGFTIRNNGVVIRRGYQKTSGFGNPVLVNSQIPLLLGSNHIAIELGRYGRFATAYAEIERRRSDPVRAVIVGVRDYPQLGKSSSGQSDAESMKAIMINFTAAGLFAPDGSETLTVLEGDDATKNNILESLSKVNLQEIDDPFLQGYTEQPTLLFYFAGLGGSYRDLDQTVVRCLLPANSAELTDDSCISWPELNKAIDPWSTAVIILDTSYDGPSATVKGPEQTLSSRTLADFRLDAEDKSVSPWRPNNRSRLLLSASAANVAALETGQYGLFTSAFSNAINLNKSVTAGMSSISLAEVFERATAATFLASNRSQMPSSSGVLDHPLRFSKESVPTMSQEVTDVVQAADDDFEMLRLANSISINHALSLINKVAMIGSPDSETMKQQMVSLLLYEDNWEDAKHMVTTLGLSDKDPASDIEKDCLARWLRLRSQISMRSGDLAAATADVERSLRLEPSNIESKYALANLYATQLRYREVYEILAQLVTAENLTQGRTLSDEQWERVRVWLYISSAMTRGKHDAKPVLDQFLHPPKAKSTRNDSLAKPGLPKRGHSPSQSFEGDWWHLVAHFFREPTDYQKQFESYEETEAEFDPKDPDSIKCLLHFYLGVGAMLNSNDEEAKKQWTLAVASPQSSRSEYWIARSELAALEQKSLSGSH